MELTIATLTELARGYTSLAEVATAKNQSESELIADLERLERQGGAPGALASEVLHGFTVGPSARTSAPGQHPRSQDASRSVSTAGRQGAAPERTPSDSGPSAGRKPRGRKWKFRIAFNHQARFRERALVAVFVWIVLGAVWALIQFGVSEVFYQLSNRTHNDEFADRLLGVSDFFAWPAGRFYESRLAALERAALGRILDQDELTEEKRDQVRSLLVALHLGRSETELEVLFELRGLIDEFDEHAEVPAWESYAVYGGICLAWGALFAMLGFLVTLTVLVCIHRVPSLSPSCAAAVIRHD